jgi:hypothetical protein
MKWYKKFNMKLSEEFKTECTEFIKNNPPEPPNAYYTVGESDMWTMWLSEEDSEVISDIREAIKLKTGLNLKYDEGFVVIWNFNDNFKECPTHIDSGRLSGGKHNGSVCVALNGNFKINLRSEEFGGDILDEVIVDDKSVVALNNTVFPHNVEGKGDLIVFGVDLLTEPEVYWHD